MLIRLLTHISLTILQLLFISDMKFAITTNFIDENVQKKIVEILSRRSSWDFCIIIHFIFRCLYIAHDFISTFTWKSNFPQAKTSGNSMCSISIKHQPSWISIFFFCCILNKLSPTRVSYNVYIKNYYYTSSYSQQSNTNNTTNNIIIYSKNLMENMEKKYLHQTTNKEQKKNNLYDGKFVV